MNQQENVHSCLKKFCFLPTNSTFNQQIYTILTHTGQIFLLHLLKTNFKMPQINRSTGFSYTQVKFFARIRICKLNVPMGFKIFQDSFVCFFNPPTPPHTHQGHCFRFLIMTPPLMRINLYIVNVEDCEVCYSPVYCMIYINDYSGPAYHHQGVIYIKRMIITLQNNKLLVTSLVTRRNKPSEQQ